MDSVLKGKLFPDWIKTHLKVVFRNECGKDKTTETEHLKLQKTGKEVFSKHWARRKHGSNNKD